MELDQYGNPQSRAGLSSTSERQSFALQVSRGQQRRGILERMAGAASNRIMRESFTETTRQGNRGDIS